MKELPFELYLELYLSVIYKAPLPQKSSHFAHSFHTMQQGFWSSSFLKLLLLLCNIEKPCMARAIRKRTYCGVRRSLRERGTVKSTSLDLFMLAKKSLQTRQDDLVRPLHYRFLQ